MSVKIEIIINIESLETRVAILENGKLDNFHIERKEDHRIVGSVFKGKIQNLEDGLQAAFVDIGLKKNAFIHYWDMIPEDAARLERAGRDVASLPAPGSYDPQMAAELAGGHTSALLPPAGAGRRLCG